MPLSAAEYLQQIQFQHLQPSHPTSEDYAARITPSEELQNTLLPEAAELSEQLLHTLLGMPRMSTFAVASLINKMVREMPADQCFLNVGTWCGFSFFSGILGNPQKKCIGVDNFSEFNPDNQARETFMRLYNRIRSQYTETLFYEMDYQYYFQHHQDPVGMYIYDGEHSYANQLKGLQIAEPVLAHGALILVDDTNMPHVHQATLDFIALKPDQYTLLADLKTANNCHPTFWNGIMLLQKTPAPSL
jgi:hypothetical protein